MVQELSDPFASAEGLSSVPSTMLSGLQPPHLQPWGGPTSSGLFGHLHSSANTYPHTYNLKRSLKEMQGAREMAQWLRALPLAEDLGPVPSVHVVAHNHP